MWVNRQLPFIHIENLLMPTRRFITTLVLFGVALVFSACNLVVPTPAPPFSIADVPLFPGAQQIDVQQSRTAVDNEQRALGGVREGDKFEFRVFSVPQGTTANQVEDFYRDWLRRCCAILDQMDDKGGRISGSFYPLGGYQIVTVDYFTLYPEEPPVLMIGLNLLPASRSQ
jgi:hypothetical protein